MHDRTVDIQLHLLDRQVVDPDGRPVCKVDDLELQPDETGAPEVTAILVGPRALGPRLGGRAGRWITEVAARMATRPGPEPERIPLSLVTDLGSAVTVDYAVDRLRVHPLERWVDDHVIGRIPGSGHASQ